MKYFYLKFPRINCLHEVIKVKKRKRKKKTFLTLFIKVQRHVSTYKLINKCNIIHIRGAVGASVRHH